MLICPASELVLTPHEIRVRRCNRGFGNPVPERPVTPDSDECIRQIRLILEEAIEMARACGLSIKHYKDDPNITTVKELEFEVLRTPNLVEIIDGVADVSVTNIGMAALCGVAMTPILEEVDANNWAKISGGHRDSTTGKWIKPAGHRPPDIAGLLRYQGWQEGK